MELEQSEPVSRALAALVTDGVCDFVAKASVDRLLKSLGLTTRRDGTDARRAPLHPRMRGEIEPQMAVFIEQANHRRCRERLGSRTRPDAFRNARPPQDVSPKMRLPLSQIRT